MFTKLYGQKDNVLQRIGFVTVLEKYENNPFEPFWIILLSHFALIECFTVYCKWCVKIIFNKKGEP